MSFIRFVLNTLDQDSGTNAGIFGLAHRLRDDPNVPQPDREELKLLLDWFGQHLKTPDRFNTSKSKGYYRRSARGIAWFRDTSADCVSRMHRMKQIFESYRSFSDDDL
jgi:hypothetical protein